MRQYNLRILLLLSLGHMVTDIYQGALPAILPYIKENLSLSYTVTGIILMAANFTSSIIQPLFGFFSDRSKKPLLLPVGCLCAGAGLSLLALPSSYIMVLVLVILSGLGVASYHPEGYKTASYFTGDKRVTGMTIFSVGGNLGFALGPLISIYVIKYIGFPSLYLMIMPSLIFMILIFLYWHTVTLPQGSLEEKLKQDIPDKRIKEAYLSLSLIIAFVMVRSWMQMGLMSYIPFYYINYLHGDPLYAGQLVFTLLISSVFGTLALAPLADKWGHKRFLVLSMLLATLVSPLFFFAKGLLMFAVLGILGALIGSTFTVTIVMAQHLMPKNLGIASGLIVGLAIGAGGVCVTLLGVVADHYGVPVALNSVMVLPVVALLLSIILRYPENITPSPRHQ
ncbi:MAG: MFS transporter [Syntrophales bacterium]|jgi:FSR family fosmidomycin resistance protein-like MFS transporter